MTLGSEHLSGEFATLGPDLPRGVAKAWGYRVLGEFDYEVGFDGQSEVADRLQVIYAENGMGKTNFLRALYYLLNPRVDQLQALAEIPIHKVGVEFRSGWTLEMVHSDAKSAFAMTFRLTPPNSGFGVVEIKMGAEELDGRYARRSWFQSTAYLEFNDLLERLKLSTVFVGDDRAVLSSLDSSGIPIEPLTLREQKELAARSRQRTSVRESLDKLERAFTRMAIAGISREQSASSPQGVYLDITRRVLDGTSTPPLATDARADLMARARDVMVRGADYEKYGLLSLRQVRGILDALTHTRSNDTRLRQLHTVIDPYLTSIRDEIERLAVAQQVIDTFVRSVNGFLRRKELKFSALNGIALEGDPGESLDPENLSSGEKHLLLLLSSATLARFSGSLVIIDEPELSLGIRWQRMLLSELLECTRGSDVQFLVASHSVQILGDIDQIVSPTDSQ